MGSVSKLVLYYADLLSKDNHHRYKSWEHCYSFFRTYRDLKSDADIDLASLHLGFYLASWGMYRGSSFLLQKDYKIHKYAISVLLDPKYCALWDLDMEDILENSNLVELIFDLKDKVIEAYVESISEVNGVPKQVNVSDTLITKILLGTMGCTPAYDRFFIDGQKESGFKNYNFDKKSFNELLGFYQLNASEFLFAQNTMSQHGTKYPMMKLIDMYFWQLGYNKDQDKPPFGIDTGFAENIEGINEKEITQESSSWQKLREAIDYLVQPFTKKEILNYVIGKYGNINDNTLQCQIYRCTVNRPSRVNWHPNKQERVANSKYDLLFDMGKGRLEKYTPQQHGLWEIKKVGNKYEVCQRHTVA